MNWGKNSCPVLDNRTLVLSCGTVWCHIPLMQRFEVLFHVGVNLVWVIVAFWPILLDLCCRSVNTGKAHIQGVWLLKCETGCIIDQGFSPFCILCPISHFVRKETSPSLNVYFPKKFNVLLINGHSYFVTSCPTQLSWLTSWETLQCLCGASAPFPICAFIRWCFGTRLS